MQAPAPLAVTVEIRALDVGARVERAFRLTRAISLHGLLLGRDLPFEAGRPVRVSMRLPDQDHAIAATGVVETVAPAPGADEPARPRAVAFTALDEQARVAILRYVDERIRTK